MSGRDSKRYEGNGIVYRRNMKTQKDGVSPSRASSVSSPPSQHSRGSVRKTPRTAADSIRSRRALPGEQVCMSGCGTGGWRRQSVTWSVRVGGVP